jgi:hypothetical protein
VARQLQPAAAHRRLAPAVSKSWSGDTRYNELEILTKPRAYPLGRPGFDRGSSNWDWRVRLMVAELHPLIQERVPFDHSQATRAIVAACLIKRQSSSVCTSTSGCRSRSAMQPCRNAGLFIHQSSHFRPNGWVSIRRTNSTMGVT